MRPRVALLALLVLLPVSPLVAGDDFYEVPSRLSRYEPGEVIKSERVRGLVASLAGVTATRIMYRSRDPRGRAIAVTGLVFAPAHGRAPEGGWPLLHWTHGTTGVGDACAPSKHRNLYWDVYAAFVGRLVRDGFVVVATDYPGLGTPGLHPWLEIESEALSVIDGTRAAHETVDNLSRQWAVVGHSQGGQAALGTGEIVRRHGGERLVYVGAVSLAPASHLAVLAPFADAPDAGWDLLAYAAASIKKSDPDFDYAEMLVPPLLTEMPRAEVTCDIELFEYFSTTYSSGLTGLRPDWQQSEPVAAWFARNEPGQRPSHGPILLVQGTDDTLVPEFVTTDLAARLCGHGDVVEYQVFAGADHDSVLVVGYDVVRTWLRERFAGKRAPSNC